jgi:hypothetical protein
MDPESPLYLKSLRAHQTHPQTSTLFASYMNMDTEKSPHTHSHTGEGERGRGRRPFHPGRLVGYSTISLTPNTPAGRRNRPFIRMTLCALVLLFVGAAWSGWAWERESLRQGTGLSGKGDGGNKGWIGGGSVLGPWVDNGAGLGANTGVGAGTGTGGGEGGDEGAGEFAPAMVDGMGTGQDELVRVDAMGMEREASPESVGFDEGSSGAKTVDVVVQVEDDDERVDHNGDDYNDDNDDNDDDDDDDDEDMDDYEDYEDYEDMDDRDDDDDLVDGNVATESAAEPAQTSERSHAGKPALGEAPVLDTIGMEVW